MEYSDMVNETHELFFRRFKPTEKLKCFHVQSKILTSSILLLLFEKVSLKSPDEINKIQLIISKDIDDLIFSDPEIMRCARVSNDQREFGFAWLAITSTIKKFNKLNIALADGSLKLVIGDLQDIFYGTYIRPLSRIDNLSYFSNFTSEFLKYKEIFLSDYLKITSELKTKLS